MEKNVIYYRNSVTGETTADKLQAKSWVQKCNVLIIRWSDVCQDWVVFMEWEH